MYYGFDFNKEEPCIGALLVYGIYRSRDVKRFKVKPDMWTTIEAAVKGCAKRALDLNDFIERLKPKLKCGALNPKHMATDSDIISMVIDRKTGELIQKEDYGRREFWTTILAEANDREVLDELYRHTSLVIALVRDRLEREKKFIEAGIIEEDEDIA